VEFGSSATSNIRRLKGNTGVKSGAVPATVIPDPDNARETSTTQTIAARREGTRSKGKPGDLPQSKIYQSFRVKGNGVVRQLLYTQLFNQALK
jgi:hypothetical protein